MSLLLTLEALDVWFFRTSRPFGAVQVASSGGEADLIPAPGVVLGGIRTSLWEGNPSGSPWSVFHDAWAGWLESPTPGRLPPEESLARRLGPPRLPEGTPWPDGAIRSRGCLPARFLGGKATPLFPVPAFIVQRPDDQPGGPPVRTRALPISSRGLSSAGDLRPVCVPTPVEGSEATREWNFKHKPSLLTQEGFAALLRGDTLSGLEAHFLEPDQLAVIEPRTGIARDVASRTVREGHLYSLDVRRWRSRVPFVADGLPPDQVPTFGLIALLEGITTEELRPPLLIHLGGERRVACGRSFPGTDWLTGEQNRAVLDAVEGAGGWFLTLATPGMFHTGWHPDWVRLGVASCGRLVGLVADPPRLVSGWDLGRQCPKPLRRLMPAGTTWFFESLPGGRDLRSALGALQGACVADEESHAGAGLVFVGAWNPKEKA